MQVFVSWSGRPASRVAAALRTFIGQVLPGCKLLVSTQIRPGFDWRGQLSEQIDAADLGIVCLTRRRAGSPWVLFESGAIWKSKPDGRLIPYLIDLAAEDSVEPLTSLQPVAADRAGTESLVESIAACWNPSPLRKSLWRGRFNRHWPALREAIHAAIAQGDPEDVDISGEWEYTCTPIGDLPGEWGGTCTIEERYQNGQSEWRLFGYRRWTTDVLPRGRLRRSRMRTALYWDTNWLTVGTDRQVLFTYSIDTQSGKVTGFARGDLKIGRTPLAIEGKFYQLPPGAPNEPLVHGNMRLERIARARSAGNPRRRVHRTHTGG